MRSSEIKQVEADIRKEDADARLKSERQLRDLRKQRDELQLKKEITVLQQDIKTVEKRAHLEPGISELPHSRHQGHRGPLQGCGSGPPIGCSVGLTRSPGLLCYRQKH